MHIHLPKPLHGWREFLGEVGVIVLGVLIALAAEQAVESWHWHEKTTVVRKSLMAELANDRARWEVDVAWVRCAQSDTERLNDWALGPAKAPPPDLRITNLFLMHSANWGMAATSQALDHFPIEEQLRLGALYDGIAHRQVDIERAIDLFERIGALLPQTDSSSARIELTTALGSLKWRLKSLADNDGYMRRHFDALRVRPDRSDFAAEFGGDGCT